MQLVATLNNIFFRAISTSEEDLELEKNVMLQDKEGLDFKVMSDAEFELWLNVN